MDRHLNLFKFFNQNDSAEYLEKNISRALVLCLQNDTLLLHQFIKVIISKQDYEYLLANKIRDSKVHIDIEKAATQLQASSMRSVYAIMLTEQLLEEADFFNLSYTQHGDYQPVTDIVISIGDILIMIEVKRTNENCKQQLYNQLHVAFEKRINQKTTTVKSITWRKVLEDISRVNTFNAFTTSPTLFTDNFINLVRQHKLHWLPVEPFSNLSSREIDNDKRYRRLEACILSAGSKLELLNKSNRSGFKFQKAWADEILMWFGYRNKELFLNIYLWPANTKGQGWPVFYNTSWDWLNTKSITTSCGTFEIEVTNEIKFSHIQGNFLGAINHSSKEEVKEINTTANFEKYAGKVDKNRWKEIESFLDSHFIKSFDWRAKCDYDDFTNSGRTFYNLSLGFQVCVAVPYSVISFIDTKAEDSSNFTALLVEINNFFEKLLD
ncbi:hypothetical protein GCM10023311_13280 [Flaviramulus aquimarinus]|uniref:PD-(D/E)XK nuclease superfamily protein n=1 Tax=Flaviramulus aquimarinus TaxID=1170456 RepID=A0ABP9F044_9FLAO